MIKLLDGASKTQGGVKNSTQISYLKNWWMMIPFTEVESNKQRTDLGIREFIVEFRDFGRTLQVKMFSMVSRLKISLTSHPKCFFVCPEGRKDRSSDFLSVSKLNPNADEGTFFYANT